ncbi:MAG: RecX family transcriptional regulator [Bacteroidales bacterium]|nr:RecX family transcriptional regulator [Bacteroidales bacterium]
MASQRAPVNKLQALAKLQAMCARAERCSADVRRKLAQWGLPDDETEWVLRQLMADRFVDDARYAAYFVRDKAQFNRWGRNKIALALRAKGIDPEMAAEALNQLDPNQDAQTLAELLARKQRQVKAKSTYDLKAKLIRFGLSRGFAPALVMEQVNRALADIDTDSP